VYEVVHRKLRAAIGETFALGDPSVSVRRRAIHELCWISADDHSIRVVSALSDADLDAVTEAFVPEMAPDSLRPRLVAPNRRFLAERATSISRIRGLLRGVELGDGNTGPDLMAELVTVTTPVERSNEYAVGEALKVVKKHDPSWVSSWVTDKLLDGTISGDHWKPFFTECVGCSLDIESSLRKKGAQEQASPWM
jgi:hypothetical protein